MGFLSDIVDEVRRELAAHPRDREALSAAAAAAPATTDLAAALRERARADGIAVIAEVKRASPSAGAIAPDADPATQAAVYDAAGAAAISVLTEPHHFGGSLDDLRAVRTTTARPVLRKDFLVEPDQVLEARAAGADAVLLIVSCLDDAAFRTMLEATRDLGMEAVVETHSDEDLERALATDAPVIGVNARDLETLLVDPVAARTRLARIGADRVAVLESGVRTHDDVRAAAAAGAAAVLVGETLMRAPDPGAALRELVHGAEALR
jgi:indole-3-glycerol phosphate synthase